MRLGLVRADRVARLLARREVIDHELDEAVRTARLLAGRDAIEGVRIPRWLTTLARVLPSRGRLILARDYAFREAAIARVRQAELEGQLRDARADLRLRLGERP